MNPTENQSRQEEQQSNPNPNQPESQDRDYSKTLTLEIRDRQNYPTPLLDAEDPTPREKDPNPEDIDDLTPFSPTTSVTYLRGGGPRRKKSGRRATAQGKRSQKKLESLVGTLNPIPFKPTKILDFLSQESLLKHLGLWDFVHLQFDSNLQFELIVQLIANYNATSRSSYVNDVRIKVSRADLARALKLPVKKDKAHAGDTVPDEKESEEAIGFMEELVSNWILLHGDTWMMPAEILNWTKVIKVGDFDRVDWAGLIWFMVEKELSAVSGLKDCYYASHLQCLIRSQREEMLRESPAKMETSTKEEESEVGAVAVSDEEEEKEENRGKINDESQSMEMEEHKIELSLGGVDKVVDEEKRESEKRSMKSLESAGPSQCDDSKQEEQRHWLKNGMDGHFLRRCNLAEVGVMEYGEEQKPELEVGEDREEDRERGEEAEEEVDDDDDNKEEREEEEEMGFNLSSKGDTMEGVSSENLIDSMEAQIPFNSEMQHHNNMSSGEFLVSKGGVDTQAIPGSSSIFGNSNSHKRQIGHLDNDELNVGNKRMRSDGSWQMKSSSEFDMCMEQIQHSLEKAKMMFEAKEQSYQEMIMNQQLLLADCEQRGNVIQQLHKLKYEADHRRQVEVYRLENELYLMGKVLEGYRKALKETQKAFDEYRTRFPLPDSEELIYKDAGPGGLVLSTMELEKQRLKKEEEERLCRIFIEKKIEEFVAEGITKFETHNDRVEVLNKKLLDIEKETNLLKEILINRKASKISESAPMEE